MALGATPHSTLNFPPVRVVAAVDSPAMARAPGVADLLERETELTQFAALVEAAHDGDGAVAVVEGGAGIGKTRLLAAAVDLALSQGLTVMSARGGELETGFAFGVVRQLFEVPLAAQPPDVRSAWLSGAAALAEALFAPEALNAPDQPEPPFAVLHGLYWLAANISLAAPALLVVDDVHWCDEPSLRWLVYLAQRLEGLPLLVLAAARPTDDQPQTQLLGLLGDGPSTTRIRLADLGEASAAILAERRLGVVPDPQFTTALHRGSGGNPLYLAALLDAVEREKIEPDADQAARVHELAPESVARDVAARLSHLPTEATQALVAAAILGDGTPLHIVATLTGLAAIAVARAAGDLCDAGLLSAADPIEFRHPVVRTAVLARLGVGDRLTAARRAAEVLVQSGGRAERAASYLIDTLPDGDPFVVRTLRDAASRAGAQDASAAAVGYLRRALAEPPTQAELPDVLHELGVAELNAGSDAAAGSLRASVAALPHPSDRPDLVLAYARSLILLGDMTAATELLAPATAALNGAVREQLEAHLLMAAMLDPSLRSTTEAVFAAADATVLCCSRPCRRRRPAGG